MPHPTVRSGGPGEAGLLLQEDRRIEGRGPSLPFAGAAPGCAPWCVTPASHRASHARWGPPAPLMRTAAGAPSRPPENLASRSHRESFRVTFPQFLFPCEVDLVTDSQVLDMDFGGGEGSLLRVTAPTLKLHFLRDFSSENNLGMLQERRGTENF